VGCVQNPCDNGSGSKPVGGDGSGPLGVVNVQTRPECKDVCLLSDLPIMAGLYDVQGKSGVYYEVHIDRMDGIIAIGM